MKTMDRLIEEFLQDQYNRLKEKTYHDYERVIELFQVYLNGYAPNGLSGEEKQQWEAAFKEDEDCYTRMFGAEKITTSKATEFLDYFIIRKVLSSESFLKLAVRVMKKWTKWLFDKHYIDEEQYIDIKEYLDESNDLPDVEKLSNLIFDYSRKTMDLPFEDVLEGYFTMIDAKPGQLWVTDAFLSDEHIGPIQISEQIANLCREGWDVNLVIGLYQGKWYIMEVGNVYRI